MDAEQRRASFAQSNVDVIYACLNATPEEHWQEVEEERWEIELGERVGLRFMFGESDEVRWFVMVAMPYLERLAPGFVDGRYDYLFDTAARSAP